MKTIRFLEALTARYNFWMALYRRLHWLWIGEICFKLEQEIQDVYSSNPGLEAAMNQIVKMREQILSQFSAASLLTMNKTTARRYIAKLIQEHNDASLIFKPSYAKLIKATLAELKSLGLSIHIHMPKGEDWSIAPELKIRTSIRIKI